MLSYMDVHLSCSFHTLPASSFFKHLIWFFIETEILCQITNVKMPCCKSVVHQENFPLALEQMSQRQRRCQSVVAAVGPHATTPQCQYDLSTHRVSNTKGRRHGVLLSLNQCQTWRETSECCLCQIPKWHGWLSLLRHKAEVSVCYMGAESI